VLALVDLRTGERGERTDRYTVPFVLRDGVLREAMDGDGAWRALAAAIAGGLTLPALARTSGDDAPDAVPDAALVCRPSPGLAETWGERGPVAAAVERALGGDVSGDSVVLGDALLLTAYRRILPGLNPDLELTAYLSEEARFPGVPRLAGWAEAVTRDGGVATVAMLGEFVPGAEDVGERTTAFLAELIAAPGSASLEWATEVADDIGTLVAGLHAALSTPPADAPDLATRAATHDELKAWRLDAHRGLNRAIDAAGVLNAAGAADPAVAAELRRAASAIAARVSRFEAVATAPTVMRIHGDLHLGRLLVAEDGYRVAGFEGDPRRPIEDRRRPDSPLRDVASVLRSLDRVARAAGRRAEESHGGPLERPGLDVDVWIERARARFLGAYLGGLRHAGAPVTLDLDLLDAFEMAKEVQDIAEGATTAPSRLPAVLEGMRWLVAHGDPA
jgi:maltose alpha-D-glucosyltransferase/alpha-amylase